MAERARIMVRGTATLGAAAFAAAALMGLSTGSAAADNFGPSCQAPQGPMIDNGVRLPAVQGELRAAGDGEVLSQGSVNGQGSRNLGRAVPNGARVYPWGGLGDNSSSTAAVPRTSRFGGEIPNACR